MTTSQTAAASTAPAATTSTAAAQNPLLATWTGPYDGVPPWDQVRPELFRPAFDTAFAEYRAEIAAIAGNAQPATFDNTIAAMDKSGATLDRVASLFGVMTSNLNSAPYQKLDAEMSPLFAALDDEITFNAPLFARIEAVHNSRETAGLDAEQQRLTKRVYDRFVRQGAKLDAAQKAQLAGYNKQLASLFSEFSTKVLADENKAVTLDSAAQLAGVPAATVASYKAAADARGMAGKWAVANTRSAVDPFLTFATDRAARETVWRAFVGRGDNGDANDTNATIAKIVKLRADRARLLGFQSHAHYRMQDTMAKDPKAAMALMMRVWPAAVARVKEEVRDMQAVADKEGAKLTIEPWDYRFYAEKVRKARYDLDQAELKPYFELDNMIKAAFWAAERRYDIRFKEITGTIPVFHPDVRVWEVTDAPSGAFRGLFYGDNFARDDKRSGAWATTYRSQSRLLNEKPLSSNNNNFTKAAGTEKTLISLDDAETLFHEFGHGLHSLLANNMYPGLSGTPRDFVEFPSQVNERWVLDRETLDKFARHYQTGAAMPQALLDKVKKSEKFNQGFITVEYLADAIVDMNLHMDPNGVVDPDRFEREDLARIGMPKEVVLRHRLPHFSHLFSSDAYSAGYYSYLWSDVMASDAWEAFVEAGGAWDKPTSDRFRKTILANGNSIDRGDAYRQFRGRDPNVDALLRDRGFPVTAARQGD